MASNDTRIQVDEGTPLLTTKPRTPLPWGQVNLVLLMLIAEPVSSAYIFPFINQLIKELGVTGGDDRKIGYYAGLIESLFFVTQALTVWQWSRLSDFIGRRPVILVGLFGLSLSSFAFGISRTLPTLIISRCIAGVLNGNVGVMQGILGDITDETNMARAMTILPATFCIGATVAPLYGGALIKPQEQWPQIFLGKFWATYPYFLPSFVSGCFILLTFVICAISLKESLPSITEKSNRSKSSTGENPPDDQPTEDTRPLPMLTLLRTYSVMLPIINGGVLGLLDISHLVLLPLFYSSPIEIGGLGFQPASIGTFLAIFGIADASVQALLGAKLIEWFGAKRVFCWAVLCLYPSILLFPIMTAVVTAQGKIGPIIWILLACQLTFMTLMDIAFPVIFIYVTRAAPNKHCLGSVGGLSHSLMSIARAIGPALTASLFAASKEYNILGGNLVYVVLAILTTILVMLSHRLPELTDEDIAEGH